ISIHNTIMSLFELFINRYVVGRTVVLSPLYALVSVRSGPINIINYQAVICSTLWFVVARDGAVKSHNVCVPVQRPVFVILVLSDKHFRTIVCLRWRWWQVL